MAIRPMFRGPRAAPTAATTSPTVTFTGGGAAPVLFEEGAYSLRIAGARAINTRNGAVMVVVTAVDVDTGEAPRLAPLLVASRGGESQLVLDNRRVLAAMADLIDGETVDLAGMLARLTDVTVGVELAIGADLRGQPINEVVDAWQLEDDTPPEVA